MTGTDWYDARIGQVFFWGLVGATFLGIAASMTLTQMRIPGVVYLFGFLGATVYAFTSFAKRFDEADRYRLKILSRTIAVFPLALGVYLLAFSFPGVSGELSALNAVTAGAEVTSADRLVAGLVFLTGIYVSATLRALGGLADRLLGSAPDGEGATSDRRKGTDREERDRILHN